MSERTAESQRVALERIEALSFRLMNSTNVDALRRGLSEIHVLAQSKMPTRAIRSA